jgi:hypothetical protein
VLYLVDIVMNERINDFENICIKCGKMYSEHPTTGRFSTVISFGHECACNPDNEFKGFVKSTLKKSGYDLLAFEYEQLSDNC